ncbi:hypothetical protein LS73_007235 [Helicobacter muridarum]|uniref:50S ribosomal protein L22 n=1 Tax=Helicobacter muridarum TaxID=216 RepID=A0A377PU14_9HELI|nr:hypothetical protein [Helicobacter muridarum]TLD99563.1 hypothetical protein LS73_007235 [Helicobacter muridarum]STQ85902.1 50S ribosomal protein L22 [Helicobacter muridarum]
MSLENNLQKITDKLAKDQSSIISAFRLEMLYKKYKVLFFMVISVVSFVIIFYAISSYQIKQTREKSNQILSKLYKIPASDETSNEQKKLEAELQIIAPSLYDFYIYTNLQRLSNAQLLQEENLSKLKKLTESKNELIATLATYQYTVISQDLKSMESFQSKWLNKKDKDTLNNNDILKDRLTLQAAYIYMQNNNIQKAHQLLDSITPKENNQYVLKTARELIHYGVGMDKDIVESSQIKE